MNKIVQTQRDKLAETIRLHRDALGHFPDEHPRRAHTLHDLANALRRRYDRTGSDDDLDERIRMLREALKLRQPDHTLRDISVNYLAAALSDRYSRTGSREDLDERIQLLREALQLCPLGHPLRDMSLDNLAKALGDDLMEKVVLFRESLGLRPPGHPLRDASLSSLAMALCGRYNRAGLEDDLVESIQLLREALELHPDGHPLRDMSLSSLAIDLCHRYDRTGSQDDLTESIRLSREAVELCAPGHPRRDTSLNSLVTALCHRYNRTGSQDDLAESIRLSREAVELCAPGHPRRDTSLNSLATALGDRYDVTGSEDNLAESIRVLREALVLRPLGHPLRTVSLNNLANALGRRYNYAGSDDDLVESIELLSEAVKICLPGHPRRDTSLNSLAVALGDRYNRTGSEDDLGKSIQLLTEALELRMPGHPLRDTSLRSLAIALCHRHNRTGSEEDLDKGIRLLREALELCPSGHSRRETSLTSLAAALGDRYDRKGSEDHLAEDIEPLREALELCLPGHPLRAMSLNSPANALGNRYSHTGSEDDITESISLHREALELCPPGHPHHATALMHLARSIWHSTDSPSKADEVFQLLKKGSMDSISPLNDSLVCAHCWVTWASEIDHNTLSDAYDRFTESLRRCLTIGPTVKLQYEVLTRQAGFLSLPMDAAAHFIQHGDVGRAVEILDEGRCLLWSEMRRFREPLLQSALVGEELAVAFEATCSELRHISTAEARYDSMSSRGRFMARNEWADYSSTGISYDELLDQKRMLLQKYDELLGLIRQKSGLEHFLRSPPFKKLQDAAKEGPIIIANCSKLGSHVVIVFSDRSPTVITLEANFYNKAVNIHRLYLDALQVTRGAVSASRALEHKLAPIALHLWDLVVLKVVQELERVGIPKASRIWWCPTSVLTVLPFHAAGDGNHYLIDSYISSYTPTLKALIDAREPPLQSSITGSASEVHHRLLAVAQTVDSKSAADELDIMRSLGPWVDVLDGPEATKQSVLEGLPNHNWVHFICHGTLSGEFGDPFESSLHLHGNTLSLNDIIKAHLPDAKFAFLAADHTAEQGRGSYVLQDEILHLAAAMHFSGFRSIIGTMWEMEDKDGPKIAKLFYAEMLKEGVDLSQRHTRAGRALWEVTRRMKTKGVSMERWANVVHIGA